jgi:hypothetical protein
MPASMAGQEFCGGARIMAERYCNLQRRRKIHADGHHLTEAQLPTATERQIPGLPCFHTVRFMLAVWAKLTFRIRLTPRTGQTSIFA